MAYKSRMSMTSAERGVPPSSRVAGPSGRPTATDGTGSRTRSTGTDVEAARQQLQRLMRDAEADIAEALSNGGWLTVLDGPLHGIWHCRGLPVIGYVKTHHRRMLARGTVGPLRDEGRSLRLLPARG